MVASISDPSLFLAIQDAFPFCPSLLSSSEKVFKFALTEMEHIPREWQKSSASFPSSEIKL